MAYARNSALPATIRNAMPAECCTIFRHACNSSLGNGSTRGRAFVAGYAAVRRAGWSKGEGGRFSKSRKILVKQRARLQVMKIEPEARVFYGWASVVEVDGETVSDWEGDGWSPAEMEKAAWDYASGDGTHGVMHGTMATSDLIASVPFTKDLQEALGIDLGKVGWLVGYRVNDLDLWDRIKSGDLPDLSIGASGERHEVGP